MTGRTYYSEEAKERARNRQIALGLSSLVTGMGIGATVALLFAPENGEQIRSMISDALEDGVSRGQDKFSDVVKRLEAEYPDLAERVRDAVETIDRKTINTASRN